KEKNLDKIPFPARNLLPVGRYYSFVSKYRNYTIMITSRGCPYSCTFCEQRTGDIRYRSPENVVAEIEECVTMHGVREIDIFDPLFTANKRRAIDICKQICEKELKICWSCRSRVDLVDDELLSWLKKAGCYRLYVGIESGDEGILKKINKNTSVAQIRKAVRLIKKHSLLAFGYFMIGCPGETKETAAKTISLAKELQLDYAQFSRLSILPGTGLYKAVEAEIGYDYWKKYVLDKNSKRELPRIDCKLSNEELNSIIKSAYLGFYLRPVQIFRTMSNIKSLDEFIRYSKAALSMIFEH
ncbi:MAG: radical SAM protein, partial [Nanoarchaeota archaeon]|nr:radical SAM protein [Nanoarchaeota archaeon]